ncbi:hypothetical protein ECDEC11C_5556 [Escherichia coli DEC11C]|nr:hypothetical protein ECDEC11C_5556 [Escherichia coli DEC11C]
MVPERVKNASGRDSGVSFLLLCFASLPDRAHSSASSCDVCVCHQLKRWKKNKCHEVYAGKTSVIHMAE